MESERLSFIDSLNQSQLFSYSTIRCLVNEHTAIESSRILRDSEGLISLMASSTADVEQTNVSSRLAFVSGRSVVYKRLSVLVPA